MKLLNKKGFMLVETLIVTAFVMSLFVLVYQTVVPSMGTYEQMESYEDIDSIYASNLWKQMITRYANTEYIDNELEKVSYIKMNDCNDTNLYINSSYCQKLKESLGVTDSDFIFITKYNISDFRSEVKKNDYFDSGSLSNFRDYIATVADVESFYKEKNGSLTGKYRLFITRTVKDMDGTTSRKFVNIGVYSGNYQKYTMGQEITFDPGDGEKKFYVLKNSPSTEEVVTLILADNLINSNVTFNSSNPILTGSPDTALNILKNGTISWTKTEKINEPYVSLDGYTIDYTDFNARLIDENDIMEVLGCKEDNETCFDYKEAFNVSFDTAKLGWFISNLSDDTGYWTSATIPGSGSYAWSVQKGKIAPTLLNESSKIGVRPVVTVLKSNLNK